MPLSAEAETAQLLRDAARFLFRAALIREERLDDAGRDALARARRDIALVAATAGVRLAVRYDGGANPAATGFDHALSQLADHAAELRGALDAPPALGAREVLDDVLRGIELLGKAAVPSAAVASQPSALAAPVPRSAPSRKRAPARGRPVVQDAMAPAPPRRRPVWRPPAEEDTT